MWIALSVTVLGVVTLLSGVWEQNYRTIGIGGGMTIIGWLSFYWAWKKQAKAGKINDSN